MYGTVLHLKNNDMLQKSRHVSGERLNYEKWCMHTGQEKHLNNEKIVLENDK